PIDLTTPTLFSEADGPRPGRISVNRAWYRADVFSRCQLSFVLCPLPRETTVVDEHRAVDSPALFNVNRFLLLLSWANSAYALAAGASSFRSGFGVALARPCERDLCRV